MGVSGLTGIAAETAIANDRPAKSKSFSSILFAPLVHCAIRWCCNLVRLAYDRHVVDTETKWWLCGNGITRPRRRWWQSWICGNAIDRCAQFLLEPSATLGL